jgi:hypothetical protein
MRILPWLPLLLVAGCVGVPPHADLAAPQPVFVPAAFFAGRTEGHARLKVIFGSTRPVHVVGEGQVMRDGTLVLDQVVSQADKPPKRREWRIRETAPGHYSGTLTDASGPVVGEVTGNCLHLTYPMKGGVKAEQWIYLQPGGATALNRMSITKFGVPVARLEETIRKQGE